jgi:hypothetical protein
VNEKWQSEAIELVLTSAAQMVLNTLGANFCEEFSPIHVSIASDNEMAFSQLKGLSGEI